MKIANPGWGGLLRAAAVTIALLLAPVAASADGTSDRLSVAGDNIDAGQDTIGVMFATDCMPPASSHSLHCHLASVPAMAAGPNLLLDDNESVAAAPAAQTRAARNFATHAAPWLRVPTVGPPRFILFGNFRS